MFRRMSKRNLILLLVMVVAAFVVPAVAAQTTDTIELVGVVESMTANSITVNHQLVNIVTAQIKTPIEIGSAIKVQGILAADGRIVAREVNAAQNGVLPGEVEIAGTLESFGSTTMVIGGQSIEVSAAQIGSGVAVGQTVKVHAIATGANSWRAREVSLFVAPPSAGTPIPPGPVGEFEIVGTLEQIGSGFIVVSGQTITLTGAEIKDALLIGVLVKAHVSLTNGVLAAREVENAIVADDNTNDNANANDNNVDDNTNANDNDDNLNSNANDNNAPAAVSVAEAVAKVLAVYPNTTVASIELTTKFGGTLVWEVKTANRVEVIIDATTGAILTIDQSGGGNSGGGSNLNNNDNHDDDNNNDNRDDDNNNDNHDDDSDGMGGDDSNDDGMGSDD